MLRWIYNPALKVYQRTRTLVAQFHCVVPVNIGLTFIENYACIYLRIRS